MTTRVLLADDHKIVRDGLHALLDEQPGVEVIAETADGRGAVDAARRLSPDVVDYLARCLRGMHYVDRVLTSEKLPA